METMRCQQSDSVVTYDEAHAVCRDVSTLQNPAHPIELPQGMGHSSVPPLKLCTSCPVTAATHESHSCDWYPAEVFSKLHPAPRFQMVLNILLSLMKNVSFPFSYNVSLIKIKNVLYKSYDSDMSE